MLCVRIEVDYGDIKEILVEDNTMIGQLKEILNRELFTRTIEATLCFHGRPLKNSECLSDLKSVRKCSDYILTSRFQWLTTRLI